MAHETDKITWWTVSTIWEKLCAGFLSSILAFVLLVIAIVMWHFPPVFFWTFGIVSAIGFLCLLVVASDTLWSTESQRKRSERIAEKRASLRSPS